jgi:hypothetical protein
VAALLKSEHWLPSELQAGAAASDKLQCNAMQSAAATAADRPARVAAFWQVPGLTITSFHLQQLQASKQVCVTD